MRASAQHIGIIACSAEGAALCYKTICTEGEGLMGPFNHPEVTMHTFPFAQHVDRMAEDNWNAVGDLLIASAHKLAQAGADFVICPDNTAHKALSLVRAHSPLPWLHIAEAVADECIRRGYKKVGLTGTLALVESDVYPASLARVGLSFERPNLQERELINKIIFEELVRGVFNSGSLRALAAIVSGLQATGCDAVVLGCTELPLLVGSEALPLPALDSTRLLARAALARAVRDASGPTDRSAA